MKVVYCEKPIATSAEEAERMIEACEKSGTLLVINHNRRFNPKYRHLRALIDAGDLGDLTSVYLRWGSGRLGCVGTHLIDSARMLTGQRCCFDSLLVIIPNRSGIARISQPGVAKAAASKKEMPR
ncbi:MAG: Gfo/Idh/MocA family oxidoreductase [Proteobacteria bacterium]|nr:Gfo/Idh/MocA family oxidoreductase [Pseudomonadota bacterium]